MSVDDSAVLRRDFLRSGFALAMCRLLNGRVEASLLVGAGVAMKKSLSIGLHELVQSGGSLPSRIRPPVVPLGGSQLMDRYPVPADHFGFVSVGTGECLRKHLYDILQEFFQLAGLPAGERQELKVLYTAKGLKEFLGGTQQVTQTRSDVGLQSNDTVLVAGQPKSVGDLPYLLAFCHLHPSALQIQMNRGGIDTSTRPNFGEVLPIPTKCNGNSEVVLPFGYGSLAPPLMILPGEWRYGLPQALSIKTSLVQTVSITRSALTQHGIVEGARDVRIAGVLPQASEFSEYSSAFRDRGTHPALQGLRRWAISQDGARLSWHELWELNAYRVYPRSQWGHWEDCDFNMANFDFTKPDLLAITQGAYYGDFAQLLSVTYGLEEAAWDALSTYGVKREY